ncbi:MAG: cation:proton antiporter [Candidatus Micrarchaeota archaeon]
MVAIESIPIVQIGVIVLASFLFGTFFSKMGFSSAVGYILAGLLLGPLGFNYLAKEGVGIGVASVFGEIGVMMLLFYLGLELNIRRFKETGAFATILAVVEMLFAFVMGYVVAKYFGFTDLEALIIGSMLTATSTVITSKFIIERKLMETTEARIIISILILEDFLAILILVFVSSLVEQQSINLLVLNAVFFVIAMFFIVSKVSKHVLNLLSSIGYEDQMWLYAIGVFITVAFFGSTYLGLSAAIGAYFAGFALAESTYGEKIKKELGMFREFFVLFFFVSFGATATLPSSSTIYIMLLVLVAGYIIVKLLSEVIFGTALGLGMKSAVTGGLLMGSVGEFALIIATALQPLNLKEGGDILSLAFLLALATTVTMPLFYSQREKITAFFERIVPIGFRRDNILKQQVSAIEHLTSDKAFQNEYVASMGNLFKNLLIAISIIYLSNLVDAQIDLPFAPLIPSKLSVSLLVLPLVIWPIYKLINELKFLTKKITNSILMQVFPSKDANVVAIEKQVGDVFSGIVLVLIGAGATAYLYFHFPKEYVFLLIPATYTLIAIMYLSRSFYGLIEQYEELEMDLGESAVPETKEIAELSKEFNEHAKMLRQLQEERLEAKEKIQDAFRTNNLVLAKHALSNFKRYETRSLINIFDPQTFSKYPKLRALIQGDIERGRRFQHGMGRMDTKEAFVKYMEEHLKPQLYEMELKKMQGKRPPKRNKR